MIINASNGEIINSKDIYIHDDILEGLYFNRAEKKLHLSILKDCKSDDIRFFIDFFDVIEFKMTSCDFWGRSPHILDFEYIEPSENTMIPKLFKKKEINNFTSCSLDDPQKYIETVITFISGDQLLVACKSIVI